jgi:outer membrane biosynthesis protein TonB
LRWTLAAAAVAMLLAAAYVGPAYADDTTPTPTTPAPDPAPPPPKPKPPPKPASKPAASPKPAPVYHAPVQHSTPAPSPQPTYTPPVVHHSTPKVVHRARPHKRAHKRPKPVAVAPKVHQVKHAAVVQVAAVPTADTTAGGDAVRRSITIAGVGLAAILFLLVLAVPATAARFTPPGRVLMDHQTDLLLVGIAVLLLTALLFAVTGNA